MKKVPIMQNIWRMFMISKGFKKQLIANAYKIQLLPVMVNKINKISTSSNKRIQNWLLFGINYDESLWIKYNYNNIEFDFRWFLDYLIDPIYLIYYKSDIQKHISSDIERTLYRIRNIDESPDYVKYMGDIYA